MPGFGVAVCGLVRVVQAQPVAQTDGADVVGNEGADFGIFIRAVVGVQAVDAGGDQVLVRVEWFVVQDGLDDFSLAGRRVARVAGELIRFDIPDCRRSSSG